MKHCSITERIFLTALPAIYLSFGCLFAHQNSVLAKEKLVAIGWMKREIIIEKDPIFKITM